MGQPAFPWFRVLALIGLGVGAVAGAIGATNPDSGWVVPLLVFAGLCFVGAAVDAGIWIWHRDHASVPAGNQTLQRREVQIGVGTDIRTDREETRRGTDDAESVTVSEAEKVEQIRVPGKGILVDVS